MTEGKEAWKIHRLKCKSGVEMYFFFFFFFEGRTVLNRANEGLRILKIDGTVIDLHSLDRAATCLSCGLMERCFWILCYLTIAMPLSL